MRLQSFDKGDSNPDSMAKKGRKDDQQSRHNSKASLLSAFWRVYSVLLEYTYHQDYKLQIIEIQKANEEKLQKVEENYTQILNKEHLKQKQFRD